MRPWIGMKGKPLRTKSSQEIDELEEQLSQFEERIVQMQKNQHQLEEQFHSVCEQRDVLVELCSFLEDVLVMT